MKAFFDKINPKTRVVACPSCRKKLRFPVKRGKRLQITCPECKAVFELSFSNPITALITGKIKFKNLPTQEKRRLVILGVSLILILFLMWNRGGSESPKSEAPQQELGLPI